MRCFASASNSRANYVSLKTIVYLALTGSKAYIGNIQAYPWDFL